MLMIRGPYFEGIKDNSGLVPSIQNKKRIKQYSMLDKIFKRSKKAEPDVTDPGILFGRYSDNNKPVQKVEKWNE